MLIFDLDGVLRHLHITVFGKDAETYSHVDENGNNIFYHIEKDLSILESAIATEYYEVVKDLPVVYILTSQPPHWRIHTTNWIADHFPNGNAYVCYVDNPDEKLTLLEKYPNAILVEDYPKYNDYSKIALVTHPYNKHVSGQRVTINSPDDMKKMIEEHYNQNDYEV